MSYSMLSRVNFDHDALLDLNTLQQTAQEIFSTFFLYFASNDMSQTNEGYVFQLPNETLPFLGTLQNSTTPNLNLTPTWVAAPSTVTLHITESIEMLNISKAAGWISMTILFYLIVTCAVLTIASRRYNSLLLRRVNSIADVAVLVVGSTNLLRAAQERSLEDMKQDPYTTAKLGWFVGNDGHMQWGIEIDDMASGTDNPTLGAGADMSYDTSYGSAYHHMDNGPYPQDEPGQYGQTPYYNTSEYSQDPGQVKRPGYGLNGDEVPLVHQ
jgi:hypothetical protein